MTADKQTLGFQTEVKQLLQLMIHSLYSNKEIFLRELISNASDAIDKLRFAALENAALTANHSDFSIHIAVDNTAQTITITDNGIGMTQQEVIDHLGTIARSGTKEFLHTLSGDQAKDAHLIGQFGVGFYSAFIVANKVTVLTRRAGTDAEQGVKWESTGEGEYSVESMHLDQIGTTIILHLRPEAKEFLEPYRLRQIITKYSDHITVPVTMTKLAEAGAEKSDIPPVTELETINRATALWTRPKNEITDTEYQEFYKHIAHDFTNPLLWHHSRVEGKQEYTILLYIPAQAPFDLFNREKPHGLKLYVKRVFIMDDAEAFLPTYLRFVRGIIDSQDLPLNISREILQNNKLVETIKTAITKKILSLLENLAKDDQEKYQQFWQAFGQVLKEGPSEDWPNREQIAKLLRFSSTQSEAQNVALDNYIARMQPEQEKIYYVTAENFSAANTSPHLEIFRKKGIEVLLLTDRIDEWLVSHLTEYQGKTLQSITKGDLALGKLADVVDTQQQEKLTDAFTPVIAQIKTILDQRVKDVRLSERLTTSPSCVVTDNADMGGHLQRLLKATGQQLPETLPIFELNPDHALVQQLRTETDDERFKNLTLLLFDQAVLAESGQLTNAADFIQRLNNWLLA